MNVAYSEEDFQNGEKFVYRSYDCRITYNGIRPHFTVDGENAEDVIDEFEVSPESIGQTGWKYTLMKAIDEMDGIDTNTESYVGPKKRELIRQKSRDYMYFFADVYSFKGTHEAIVASDFNGIADIHNSINTRAKQLIDKEKAFGLEAFKKARTEVFEKLIE